MPYVRPLNPGESPLAFFGAEVRRARERRNPTMPQSELASMVPCHSTVVSKVECAELEPPDGFPEGCDRAFPEMGGFFTQFRQHFPKWSDSGIIPPWFRPWVQIEERASVIRWLEPTLVPGLLQTPEYAEAVLSTWKADTAEEIKSKVDARIDRQHILDRDPPPELWFLIGEYALNNQIGTEATMAGQIAHLAEMSRRPHVTIQLIPATTQVYAALTCGALFIATVDNSDVAHFDTLVQGMTVHDPTVVGKAVFAFDRMRAEALPIRATQELIAKVGEKWKI
jgi:Domain of unknown function (DUF5753)